MPPPIERDALDWEHEGNRAVREGDWKLVARGPGGPWELYDLACDRVESKDRAAEQPERVAHLRGKWETWARRTDVLPWGLEARLQAGPAAGLLESINPLNRDGTGKRGVESVDSNSRDV